MLSPSFLPGVPPAQTLPWPQTPLPSVHPELGPGSSSLRDPAWQ